MDSLEHGGFNDLLAAAERCQVPVCGMARYPNVALKWCHAPGLLSEEDDPYRDVMPPLRQAPDAFGAERVMRASDHTVARDQNAKQLGAVPVLPARLRPALTDRERWLLGGSARHILNWTD